MDDGWMGPAALPEGSVGLEFTHGQITGVFRKFGVGDGNAAINHVNIIRCQWDQYPEFELPLEPTLYQITFESAPAELIGGCGLDPAGSSADMRVVYVQKLNS